eukprot:gene52507-16130_t
MAELGADAVVAGDGPRHSAPGTPHAGSQTRRHPLLLSAMSASSEEHAPRLAATIANAADTPASEEAAPCTVTDLSPVAAQALQEALLT